MTLRIHELAVPVDQDWTEESLRPEIADFLGIDASLITHIHLRKKSLDARKKSSILFKFQIDIETLDDEGVVRACGAKVEQIEMPSSANPLEGLLLQKLKFELPPVIIGTGPAGIFAALTLARAGVRSMIVERGDAVETRMRTVNRLRRDGILSEKTNYCFGEGGAGTFSDGKLSCGKNHPLIRHVFEEFVRFGSPRDILFEAKPHIGTDYLMRVALNMRKELQRHGSEFLFGKKWVDFEQDREGLFRVELDDGTTLETKHLIVAVGHSARDTYGMLLEKKLAMVPKPFAMGARIEHPQELINKIQFGSCPYLPAAEYKLVAHEGERGIWTFCMCPGGHLLPTSAQEGHLAINGMSYHGRKSGFANAAVVVNVLREDFYRDHPLDGMHFQANLEREAFRAGGGSYHSPAQRLVDFMTGRESRGELHSTYKPGIQNFRMDKLLPDFIVASLRASIHEYDKKMRGYLNSQAIIVGLESKTSAPISMMRGKDLQSISHPGFFPAGEGAGFAGGIVSAALDGVRVGRAVVESALT